jgi:hypothetical protein
MKRVRKNVSVILDIKAGEVKVVVDGTEAAKAEFVFDDTQIMISSVNTEKLYKRSGYGRLLFDTLKCLSNQRRKPLILWSSEEGIKFYEKIGLLHLDDPKVQKRIIFGNLNTTEEILEKVDDDDFVWIPQSLGKKKAIIYL